MQASEVIQNLEGQIADATKRLERLQIKLEVARELATEVDDCNAAQQDISPQIGGIHPVENGRYHLQASDAILLFLADKGQTHRTAILDALEHQIETASKKPRNIVRNCMSQLAGRGKLVIDADGNVSPVAPGNHEKLEAASQRRMGE